MKTMKTTLNLILFLFLGFYTANLSIAQCGSTQQPCVPDCPNDPWLGPNTVTYTVEPGCQLKITYVHRHACNQFYDYQVLGVEVIGTCSFGTGIDEVLDQATIALLSGNPQNYPIPNCQDVYRATKAACWSEDGSGCYTPCPPVQCDLELYRLCNGTLTQVTRWTANVNCVLPCERITPLSE